MTNDESKRPYRKRKRARSEEETRRRITEAAVELHGTVGPAQTRVTELAKRAGVSRMTVYNHFPTDADIFAACSSHWVSRNPFPDPRGWSEVVDPGARLQAALDELYVWYGESRGMLENVLRDAPRMDALRELVEAMWVDFYERCVTALAEGWTTDAEDDAELRAMLRLVLDFHSWKVLDGAGPSGPEAAGVAARMVRGAVGAWGQAAAGESGAEKR